MRCSSVEVCAASADWVKLTLGLGCIHAEAVKRPDCFCGEVWLDMDSSFARGGGLLMADLSGDFDGDIAGSVGAGSCMTGWPSMSCVVG